MTIIAKKFSDEGVDNLNYRVKGQVLQLTV